MKNGKLAKRKWKVSVVAAVAVAGVVLVAGIVVTVRGCGHAGQATADTAYFYQCSMHPQIVQDHPGSCPICHMTLVKVAREKPGKSAGDAKGHAGRILKYQSPMDPTKVSDKPMKDSMGMDYVPVYADSVEATTTTAGGKSTVPGKAAFALTEERRQLIGVKTGVIERRALSRRLRLPGRVTGGGRVTAELLEMDAGTVRAGMRATLAGSQEQTVDAVVAGVDSGFDALTRSYAVTLTPTEDAGWLKPGVYVEADVLLDFGKRLAIPADAVLYSGERKVVFLTDGKGSFAPREVKLGKAGEDWVEVLSGVKEGDRVVTSANFLIDSESQFRAALEQYR
ncbi:MAG: heavy metal-binding domain-containing protein [Candidatus Coatesbacteria bacterium]